MLWYKWWLETRWRFLLAFAVLTMAACGSVVAYPRVVSLLPLATSIDTSGEIGRRINEAAELARSYRGYIWSQWFRQTLPQMWTLFAVLLGTGQLVRASGDAGLFTLSLPISRQRLFGTRAAAGLAELLLLAVVPSLLISLLSPTVGGSFGVGSALVHSLCLFVTGAVFFSAAILLSTLFGDIWRPLLITLFVAVVLSVSESLLTDLPSFGIFKVMSADSFFRAGHLPWVGLGISAVIAGALLVGARANLLRQDF